MSKRKDQPIATNTFNPRIERKESSGILASLNRVGEVQYNKSQFVWMAIGMGLILFGFVLMSGGGIKDPAVWDESVIYSPIRITLAPIVVLTGVVLNIYAIFKR